VVGPTGLHHSEHQIRAACRRRLSDRNAASRRRCLDLLGEFREVDPPARLAYTFRWDPPAADDRETVVILALEDQGEETKLILTQGEFATEERHALHEAGWSESLERLKLVLSELQVKTLVQAKPMRSAVVMSMQSTVRR
jgi:uncharacterized protein YndB with AHSA1/START domain